jgi:hypothetical protein
LKNNFFEPDFKYRKFGSWGKRTLTRPQNSLRGLQQGEIPKPNPNEGKNPAVVELGRLGGLKGGVESRPG